MTALLETRALSRSFGGLKAVSGVDFTLQKGEVRAVIGPNGAGKTTFVSLISGRIAPSSGTILFEGEDVTALPAHARVKRGIAYTFQITITKTYNVANLLEDIRVRVGWLRRQPAGSWGCQESEPAAAAAS